MKLVNKKFIEFSFEPNLVTNLDKGFVTISYINSWRDIFIGRKKICFKLFPKGNKEYLLKFLNESVIIKQDDRICVQIFCYKNDLHIVINRPIDAESLDKEGVNDSYGDIFVKANFKLLRWWNIKTYCNTIRTNFYEI